MPPSADRRDPDRRTPPGREIGRLAGIGLQFGAVLTLFALGGYWLDGRLGTRPTFLLLGVLLGFAGGTISLVKATARGKRRAGS